MSTGSVLASASVPSNGGQAATPAGSTDSVKPDERLIVALDVRTHDAARDLVDKLENVSFFKVGLQLLLAGDLFRFLKQLRTDHEDRAIFLDLKTAGDIQDTIAQVVDRAGECGIRFMTFIEAAHATITRRTLQAGIESRGDNPFPQFMAVTMLSDIEWPVDKIVASGQHLLTMGFDGLVASGSSIRALRDVIPRSVPIISPGIRPRGSDPNGHVRWATPTEAIQAGADYLVVGRPVIRDRNPRDVAQRIIDEIADAV